MSVSCGVRINSMSAKNLQRMSWTAWPLNYGVIMVGWVPGDGLSMRSGVWVLGCGRIMGGSPTAINLDCDKPFCFSCFADTEGVLCEQLVWTFIFNSLNFLVAYNCVSVQHVICYEVRSSTYIVRLGGGVEPATDPMLIHVS